MKFRDPRTKEVIDLESEVRDRLCTKVECDFCPLRSKRNGTNMGCNELIAKFPEKAARLMGYEVVEDDAPTMEEAINKCLEIKQKEASIEKPFDPFPIRTKNGLKIGNIELTTNGIEIDGRKIGMDKPLKDWTLGEIKRCCVESKQNCEKCPVSGEYKTTSDCKLAIFPAHWDLDDKPRFTQQEVERAKAVKVLYPEILYLQADDRYLRGLNKEKESIFLDCVLSWFPSLRSDETVTLDEIIGGAR